MDEPSAKLKDEQVTHAIEFGNGMLMVFDCYGHQVPEFQGRADEMIPRLRAAGFSGNIEMGILR